MALADTKVAYEQDEVYGINDSAEILWIGRRTWKSCRYHPKLELTRKSSEISVGAIDDGKIRPVRRVQTGGGVWRSFISLVDKRAWYSIE